MEFKGRLVNVAKNLTSNKYVITFELDEGNIKDLDKLSGNKPLIVQAKQHYNKRSLDANAYAWVLMQQIAEVTGTDKWNVYITCLQRYSRAFTHVIVKPNAIERLKDLYRVCIDLGEVEVRGQKGHQLQVYYGYTSGTGKSK